MCCLKRTSQECVRCSNTRGQTATMRKVQPRRYQAKLFDPKPKHIVSSIKQQVLERASLVPSRPFPPSSALSVRSFVIISLDHMVCPLGVVFLQLVNAPTGLHSPFWCVSRRSWFPAVRHMQSVSASSSRGRRSSFSWFFFGRCSWTW